MVTQNPVMRRSPGTPAAGSRGHGPRAACRSTAAGALWKTAPRSPRCMHLPPDNTGNHALALAGDALGYRFVPCWPGTKVPLVQWKRFQHERPTADLYERWFRGTRNNIALLTGGMVLFDCDDPALADRVLTECGDTPHKIRTPRGGIHLGYRRREGDVVRNRVRINGDALDLRTDGGLEMLPGSRTADGVYTWLGEGLIPIPELPVADIGWTRERTRTRTTTALLGHGLLREGQGRIKNPEAYCLRIESVQGQNGSRGLVRVVAVMRDAGRSKQQTFDFIRAVWGPACAHPEWSEREIWHCIDRHFPPG